ncbi:ABC transporter permease [Dyella nitratireducens]|uniref:ABC transporter permease n=1 Tax=Dyella nitratireducens TaxID=1849580 RepID=A0ABQ1FQ87_9GAMM|nr:FtsX-like permease family protein [Dyella nitratireducens]GGA24689.1 ABC transporter permease [Dyella nitratireducens]GLQ43791.1 ABC transporter permease [Dyella nitratireducens]
MHIRPIASALWHHKGGTALIVLQIALTLAIVCNALCIIHTRVARLSRPSGVDEASVLAIQNQWLGDPAPQPAKALMASDLETLRQVPGVVDAYASNAFPLGDGGWSKGVRYTVDQPSPASFTAIYFADEHTLATLGLKLVAGRNFRADEIGDMGARDTLLPRVIIITKALANRLFPDGHALGKQICIGSAPSSTIIGVVERMQTWIGSYSEAWVEQSTLVPFRLLASGTVYLVRAQPGLLERVVRMGPQALVAANPLRVIGSEDVRTYEQIRATTYRKDRGMAILMGGICAVLLATTAAGIVGLTSFWVSQRRRQIGVRRALGATQGDILGYFCTENLLISVGGVCVGAMLTMALNALLVDRFEMQRLSLAYVVVGMVALLLLGQSAVLVPAWRASRLSPVEATRAT